MPWSSCRFCMVPAMSRLIAAVTAPLHIDIGFHAAFSQLAVSYVLLAQLQLEEVDPPALLKVTADQCIVFRAVTTKGLGRLFLVFSPYAPVMATQGVPMTSKTSSETGLPRASLLCRPLLLVRLQ